MSKSRDTRSAPATMCAAASPSPAPCRFSPEPMALPIVHEDGHIIVINKPAGLVVHPAPGHFSGTLVNGCSIFVRI